MRGWPGIQAHTHGVCKPWRYPCKPRLVRNHSGGCALSGICSCSLLAVQGLALRVECFALSLLSVDCHEAFQAQRLAGLLDALSPQLCARALVALLGSSRRLLGD